MIDGSYEGSIKTPLGTKKGIVTLSVNGNTLSGSIEALGKKNTFTGGTVIGNRFTFSGTLQFIFGKVNYNAEGSVEGNTLNAVVKTGNESFQVVGTRV